MTFKEKVKTYLSDKLVGQSTHSINEFQMLPDKLCFNVDDKFIVWVYSTIDSEENLLPDKIDIQTFDNFIAKEYSNYTALLLIVITNENNEFRQGLLHENLKELY